MLSEAETCSLSYCCYFYVMLPQCWLVARQLRSNCPADRSDRMKPSSLTSCWTTFRWWHFSIEFFFFISSPRLPHCLFILLFLPLRAHTCCLGGKFSLFTLFLFPTLQSSSIDSLWCDYKNLGSRLTSLLSFSTPHPNRIWGWRWITSLKIAAALTAWSRSECTEWPTCSATFLWSGSVVPSSRFPRFCCDSLLASVKSQNSVNGGLLQTCPL